MAKLTTRRGAAVVGKWSKVMPDESGGLTRREYALRSDGKLLKRHGVKASGNTQWHTWGWTVVNKSIDLATVTEKLGRAGFESKGIE